jgi:RHH-type rel operon transcriptional repressor/antitoxin RelB
MQAAVRMLSIQFDPEIERRLAAIALQTGRTTSDLVQELVSETIEDLEDRYIADARLSKQRPPLTIQEVRKELGLV